MRGEERSEEVEGLGHMSGERERGREEASVWLNECEHASVRLYNYVLQAFPFESMNKFLFEWHIANSYRCVICEIHTCS